jgi:hypothetical protein
VGNQEEKKKHTEDGVALEEGDRPAYSARQPEAMDGDG